MNEIEKRFEDLSMNDIEKMVLLAIFDGIVECPYCQFSEIEPDYDQCPECNKKNPLKKLRMI